MGVSFVKENFCEQKKRRPCSPDLFQGNGYKDKESVFKQDTIETLEIQLSSFIPSVSLNLLVVPDVTSVQAYFFNHFLHHSNLYYHI